MGWSCRKDAMDTFEKIGKALCIGRSQNVYQIHGKLFLIEMSQKEHEDGSITGSIVPFDGEYSYPSKARGFKISGDGLIIRAPKSWKLAFLGKKVGGLEVPDY